MLTEEVQLRPNSEIPQEQLRRASAKYGSHIRVALAEKGEG